MINFNPGRETQLNIKNTLAAYEKIKANPMAGWLKIPTPETDLDKIKFAAKKINEDSDYLVCIGIGGSYLGHKAVIDALEGTHKPSTTKILYSGNSLNSYAYEKILKEIEDKDFSINVISKSGTTTEPAVAFRIFKQKLIEKYGEKEAAKRIYATTDAKKGALHDEARKNNYEMFVVPDNVGGRYSVFTPVGLLPIAVAGIDIDKLLEGAKKQSESRDNIFAYATFRALLADQNYDLEILSSFEPRLMTFNEWWKQLFGESEGKDDQGIFPASTIYTTDLHSLGQYLQQGRRNIFETVVKITTSPNNLSVPDLESDIDGLKYLEGKTLDEIAEKALEATVDAHRAGGIPVFELEMEKLDEENLGALIFFFELSCAISATLQNVNPFDQPGVEAYKNNMFRLLGKPGF